MQVKRSVDINWLQQWAMVGIFLFLSVFPMIMASQPLKAEGKEWPVVATAPISTNPAFTRQFVRVQWRENDPIDLIIIRPKSRVKPPVVLYLYSYPDDLHRFWDDRFCERLVRNGCAAVGFESALSGGRYHDRPMVQWFVSELPEALSTTAQDIPHILDYLATHPDLDVKHAGIFGRGSGATIAAIAAATEPRLIAVDLVSPWGDWPDWVRDAAIVPTDERPRFVDPIYQKNSAPWDPLVWLPKLTKKEVRVIFIARDADVPRACQEKLRHALPLGSHSVTYQDNAEIGKTFEGLADRGGVFYWIGLQLGANPIVVNAETVKD